MIFLARLWRLLRLCPAGTGGRLGLLYFAAVVALSLAGIEVTLRLIAWNANFYNALAQHDTDEVVRQIGVFAVLVALGSTQYLVATYIRKLLQIRWRRSLTNAVLDRWLGGAAYLDIAAQSAATDNPDQRIAEDCRLFVDKLTGEALDLISTLAGLFSYVMLLWQLSTFPLAFPLFGVEIVVPRYMVWLAPVYVALASGATHVLGAPLMRLAMEQQRREADFRFALARLREEGEAVALHAGEKAERRMLDGRFGAIIDNWRRLINRELLLGCFTRPYQSTVLRIPLFLALPAYLAGHVTLGGLMQVGSAFQNVVTSLSWFIFSYRDLAELGAAAGRLDGFLARLAASRAHGSTIRHVEGPEDSLRIEDLSLRSPEGRKLVCVPSLTLRRGENVWLDAPSGTGKSTLFKTLAGVWRHGSGLVVMPTGSCAFLPQRVYLPLGNLGEAALYPLSPDEAGEAAEDLVELVGLPAGADYAGLSGGEKQRLALARLLARRPDWAFLDEPTSGLDLAAEEALFAMLRRELPQTTFIVASHREPRGLGPVRRIFLVRQDEDEGSVTAPRRQVPVDASQ